MTINAAMETVTAITSRYGLARFLSSNTPPKAYLPPGALISVNQTRKVPVRVTHKAANRIQKRIPVTARPLDWPEGTYAIIGRFALPTPSRAPPLQCG